MVVGGRYRVKRLVDGFQWISWDLLDFIGLYWPRHGAKWNVMDGRRNPPPRQTVEWSTARVVGFFFFSLSLSLSHFLVLFFSNWVLVLFLLILRPTVCSDRAPIQWPVADIPREPTTSYEEFLFRFCSLFFWPHFLFPLCTKKNLSGGRPKKKYRVFFHWLTSISGFQEMQRCQTAAAPSFFLFLRAPVASTSWCWWASNKHEITSWYGAEKKIRVSLWAPFAMLYRISTTFD